MIQSPVYVRQCTALCALGVYGRCLLRRSFGLSETDRGSGPGGQVLGVWTSGILAVSGGGYMMVLGISVYWFYIVL
jgi:hypothetical protein